MLLFCTTKAHRITIFLKSMFFTSLLNFTVCVCVCVCYSTKAFSVLHLFLLLFLGLFLRSADDHWSPLQQNCFAILYYSLLTIHFSLASILLAFAPTRLQLILFIIYFSITFSQCPLQLYYIFVTILLQKK